MTVRPDYSLSRAGYTPFLFTIVGTETRDAVNGGEDITLLTALSRGGIDPWQEAARLAGLPRTEAAQSLAATFLKLPDTRWAAGDTAGAVQRLIDMLPKLRPRAPAPIGGWIFLRWQFWAGVTLVLAMVALNAFASELGPLH